MTTRMFRPRTFLLAASAVPLLLLIGSPDQLRAQGAPGLPPAGAVSASPGTRASSPPAPAGYVIGTDDVLTVIFWRDKEMSGDVSVRPDGKISVPLLNDIQAAGLTPEQLREALRLAASEYMEEPSVTVVVKQINSLRVFITGEISKPGAYPLTSATTVMQLIAIAGGLNEYANRKNIVVMRVENGNQYLFPFNYEAFSKRKNVRQNIQLKPGDTVLVR